MHVVLVEPEIPPNTGNAARTCVMTRTRLHLIEPLGFSIDDKEVRRSGLDYWSYLDLEVHGNFRAFRQAYPSARLLCFSTRGKIHYHMIRYRPDDFLVFGCETKGLPLEVLQEADHVLRVPMVEQIPRSLNLGNTVALVLYEALRQIGFPGMK
ncbi:MAG TPA: tRNA (cytidine(34)-2'-O)-methyltransferase [Firmicutes bacterium]|nr:tRNA (cytidine(34)-2'-O)-methyltransferase [Bacillota bacterium]